MNGPVHNLLMQFCTLGCLTSETYLFDIVITQNDHPTSVVGSTVDLGYLLKGQDGRLYPRGVQWFLARVLTPCTMRSRAYSGVFVPFNIDTSRVSNAHSC